MKSIGLWKTNKAIRLSPAPYPTWKATVTVTASTRFQYKYLKMKKNESDVIWESGPNRQGTTPVKGQSGTFRDSWR